MNVSCSQYFFTLVKEGVYSSETSNGFQRTTLNYSPEYRALLTTTMGTLNHTNDFLIYKLSASTVSNLRFNCFFYYSETSTYHPRMYRFSGSIVQFLWSLNKFHLNHGPRIYRFPVLIVHFQDTRRKR
jgi:hypothetical protein